MKLSRLFWPAAFLAAILSAQTATDLNLGIKLSQPNELSWWGTPANHFFVQYQTELGGPWNFVTGHNPGGNDEALGLGVPTPGADSKLFHRVIQFDPTDISGHVDSDNDGLPDLWETYYFGSLAQSGAGDWDNDGISNLREFQGGNNPKEVQATVSASLTTYTYDLNGRLLEVNSPELSVGFTPDEEGNLLNIQ